MSTHHDHGTPKQTPPDAAVERVEAILGSLDRQIATIRAMKLPAGADAPLLIAMGDAEALRKFLSTLGVEPKHDEPTICINRAHLCAGHN